ncbi:hypothetical protein I551_1078 [Mycobacterium ulcerans str. Harvey]|uniref:Uncharacterized protein n=1 Tax=Mycobacterium ulcerans str. Harvey TaxID=1299332 RepID=A0ABN0R6M5_MYCUL|nr:hypothetical protein I551_1078 [Mycobacterium ulcerans str. Harvey]
MANARRGIGLAEAMWTSVLAPPAVVMPTIRMVSPVPL